MFKKNSVTDAIKKEIDILEYARSVGLDLMRHGNAEHYRTTQHDSLIFDKNKNCFFWNSRDVSGSVIDFAMVWHDISSKEAISHLRGMLTKTAYNEQFYRDTRSPPTPAEKQVFLMPEKSKKGYGRMFAYLCKTRGLSQEVVQNLVDKKQLMQDKQGNACFLGYDYNGECSYAFKRSCLSDVEKPFRGDAAGSNKVVGFSHNLVGGKAKQLFVTEAAIDAVSIMSFLKLHNMDSDKYAFLSLGGTAPNALMYHIAKSPQIERVYLCQDNDDAGAISRFECRHKLVNTDFKGEIVDKSPAVGKDWNDELKIYSQTENKQQIKRTERGTGYELNQTISR